MTTAPDPVRTRFKAALSEQLGFLKQSAELFDQGQEAEAKRLATTLRVLFHSTASGSSTSLMKHLGMESVSALATPATHFDDWRDFLSVRIDLSSARPTVFIPRLENTFTEVPLTSWWSDAAIGVGVRVSRKKIILAAANQDGGAHVDSVLKPFYEEIRAGEYGISINGNLSYDGPPPFPQGIEIYPDNAHLALIRQFSHETLTAARHFGWENL